MLSLRCVSLVVVLSLCVVAASGAASPRVNALAAALQPKEHSASFLAKHSLATQGPIYNPFTALSAADQAAWNKKCSFCLFNESKKIPTPDPTLSAARANVLSTAAQYLRAVSDCGGSPVSDKFGADVLVGIYQEAFQAKFDKTWTPMIRKATSGWKAGPYSWCGIWAVAVLRNAGVKDIVWGTGGIEGRKAIAGNKGVRPGDVAIWAGGLNHHNIVEKIEGQTVYTLDGNQDCSGIFRRSRPLSQMAGYYNVIGD